MSTSFDIINLPSADELWRGIGWHFDSISQILCEFIDNSISNFTWNSLKNRTIIISIKEISGNDYLISIEDSGTGIKDLNSAFCLGSKSSWESPLNEHGFWMKHALASANPNNDNWFIFTRTIEDFNNQTFKKISSSYKISEYKAEILTVKEANWPGEINWSGTLVQFKCSKTLLETLRNGMSGRAYSLGTLVKILAEDLGFIYAGIIESNKATMTIQTEDKDGKTNQENVVMIKPDWEQYYKPSKGSERCDLGGGNVEIHYEFGAIKASENFRYYKRNMSSSGLEIRINGRVLETNLFKDVWGIEKHNMYNHLLVRLDIISENKEALPSTRTSKNGLREGDGKFAKLKEWVLRKMPEPRKELEWAQDEKDLFDELEKSKNIHLPEWKIVNREQNVFKNIKAKVPVDLYIQYNDEVILYEGKKDKTSIQDVYQLKMYWDGCVIDGLQPTKWILVASSHPESVISLIGILNDLKDFSGENYYKLEAKTWIQEGVNYPN